MTATEQAADEDADVTDRKGSGWGGRRPGAGRPRGSKADLVDLETQVRADQRDWLDRTKAVAGDRFRSPTVRRLLDQAQQLRDARAELDADTRDLVDGKLLEANGPAADPGDDDLVDLDTRVRRDQREWLDQVTTEDGNASRAHTVRAVLDEARRLQGARDQLPQQLLERLDAGNG